MLALIGDVLNHGHRPDHYQGKDAFPTCHKAWLPRRIRASDDKLKAEVQVAKKVEVEAEPESGSDDEDGKSDQLQRADFAVAGLDVPSPDRKVAASPGNFFVASPSSSSAADDDFVLLQAVNRCLLASTSPP